MSTRANIIRTNNDGSFDLIYTHWDGYPEHHAPILLKNYSTNVAVAALLALGDLSILDAAIGEKHSFDARTEGQCTAYGRDRGEANTTVKHFRTRKALNDYLSEAWTEWVYFWDGRKWTYTNNPSPTWFKCCGTKPLPVLSLKDWKKHEAKRKTGEAVPA